MKWIFILLLPWTGVTETKEEILQRYRQRCEDFFARQRQEEALSRQRMSGISEIKEERQKREELLERARKRFVASKPPPKDMSQAYQRYLAEEEAKKKAYLKRQERYAQIQREVEKVKGSACKIPPVLEYELQNQL